jgi:signal transduction histidine kinase/CheY-like chemotaxis protein/HAMP domain-containing protein
MMKKFALKSIKSKLTWWLVILGLLPLLIGIGITHQQQVRFIQQESFDKLETIRDLKVRQVKRWIDERIGNLKTISTDKDLVALENVFLKPHKKEDDLEIYQNIRNILQRYLKHYTAYDEIFIVNPRSGRVEISTDISSEGMKQSDNPSFTTPMQTRRLFIGDIYYSQIRARNTMTFSIPIFCAEHKQRHIVGILVACVDLKTSLYALLQDRDGLGETGETLIVNQNGLALNELRWHENAPLNFQIQAEPAVKAARGETGIIESTDYRGKKILGAYTYIPQTRWGFVAKQEQSERYAPINAMLRNLLILVVAALIIILVAAFFIAGMIVAPILRMVKTARKMQEGNFSARNPVSGPHELAALAKAFNSMAESIESFLKLQQINHDITQILVDAEDLPAFRQNILKKLVEVTGSQMGAYFSRNEKTHLLEHFASIGVMPERMQPFDASLLEGELGRVVETRKITHITDIPEDSRFVFRTFTGKVLPRAIISIPLVVNDVVAGVVSLASIYPYPREVLDMMEQPWTRGFETTLSNMRANEETARLAAELQKANQGLRVQTEELEAQTEELQAQSEELRQVSEELQEQNLELEAQKEQVEAAGRMKNEFLSNMSHELRTPLNSIMALSRVLIMQASAKLSATEAEYLEIIERNGKNLLSLINDILDLSKIEAGKMDVHPKSFSMAAIIEMIVERLEPLAVEKGIGLQQDIPADLPRIESDETRVHQILQNLMGNAVKFTREGEVRVAVHCDNEHMSVDVTDTGIGIPAKELPHIFEEFRQVDGSTARAYEGTGLGLAIASKGAAILNGKLTVDSTPGKGSAFTLTLPLQWPQPLGEWTAASFDAGSARPHVDMNPDESSGRVARSPAGIRILLVEDNEAAVIQVKTILETRGYIVDVAPSGQQALDYVCHTIPDGIILDLMMPEVDGFDVLEKIRGTSATRNIPVLVLTAKDLTPQDLGKLSANHIQQLILKGDVDREGLLFRLGLMLETRTQDKRPDAENPQRSDDQRVPPSTVPASSVVSTADDSFPTILVIEDNPDNMVTIRAMLQNRAVTREATTGEEGLELALQHHPDLILLDISLPQMDGFAVVKTLKEDDQVAHIPVLALTALAMKGDRERILQAGCDDYISKPVDPENFVEKIDMWLSRSKKE